MDQVWLEVSPHFTLTVHQDLTSITVVSDQGRVLTSLVPVLPPHHQHQHWRVQEVDLRHTVVFVRLSSEGPDTSRRGLILQADLTSLLLRPGQGSSSSTPATVVAESDWPRLYNVSSRHQADQCQHSPATDPGLQLLRSSTTRLLRLYFHIFNLTMIYGITHSNTFCLPLQSFRAS